MREDHLLIQGTWQLIEGEKSGKAFPESVAREVQIVFNNGQMTTKNGKNEFSFPFKLTLDSKPSGIDLIMNESLGKGIYRLIGDRLTLVHTEAGEPRPTEFATFEGSKLTMLVLERASSSIS